MKFSDKTVIYGQQSDNFLEECYVIPLQMRARNYTWNIKKSDMIDVAGCRLRRPSLHGKLFQTATRYTNQTSCPCLKIKTLQNPIKCKSWTKPPILEKTLYLHI